MISVTHSKFNDIPEQRAQIQEAWFLLPTSKLPFKVHSSSVWFRFQIEQLNHLIQLTVPSGVEL